MRTHWLDLFTGTTWEEFLRAGGNVSGFRESKWTTVQKIKRGDYLLCYVIGLSRFIGVLVGTVPVYLLFRTLEKAARGCRIRSLSSTRVSGRAFRKLRYSGDLTSKQHLRGIR
jgi:hypothetical protein